MPPTPEKSRLNSSADSSESSQEDAAANAPEQAEVSPSAPSPESEESRKDSLQKYFEKYFPDRLPHDVSAGFDPIRALEQFRSQEKEDLLASSFAKNLKETFEKTWNYYEKYGRRLVTLAVGIALSKIALDYGLLFDKGKGEKPQRGKAETEEVLKESFIPEEAWPITSFHEETGELIMDYRGHAVHLKRFTEGLHEDAEDKPGLLMNLVQGGLRSEKLNGVHYELENEEKFSEFVRQEAENVVKEMNAKGGQEPVELSQLTENEWLQLSFLIVQRNLEYDKLVLDTYNPASKREDDKISDMPLDTMLTEYHKGVCRHYAAEVTQVSETLKKLFPSSNLDNVSIEALSSDTLNHAYSAVLEQQDDDLNIRFVDITGQKDKFRATDDLDALKGKGFSYESAGDFLLSKAGEKMYNRDVVIETFRNLLVFNADNPTLQQFYTRELGDLFLESSSERDKTKGYGLYQKSIDIYRKNYDENKMRQQNGDKELIHLYPVVEPLAQLVAKFREDEQWDEAAELLFDNRLFSSEFTVVNPEHVSSFDRYNAMDFLVEDLNRKKEYAKILDIHEKYQLPIYLQPYAFEAQLETGRIAEAMEFLLQKADDEAYEYPEGSFEDIRKVLAAFQDKVGQHPDLLSQVSEEQARSFLSRLALSREHKGETIKNKLEGKETLAADETHGEMEKRWKDILGARKSLLLPFMRVGLSFDRGNGSILSHAVDVFGNEFQDLIRSGAYDIADLRGLRSVIRKKFPDLDSDRHGTEPVLDANLTYVRSRLQEFSALLEKK